MSCVGCGEGNLDDRLLLQGAIACFVIPFLAFLIPLVLRLGGADIQLKYVCFRYFWDALYSSIRMF
jgi:hypothetical protein